MASKDLQQYLEMALMFISRAKTLHEERLLTKAAARAIASMTKQNEAQVEKALHAMVVDYDMHRAEYRVSNAIVQPVQDMVGTDTVHADQHVIAGAKLRVGDTLYDRSAETILSDMQHALNHTT